MADGSEACSVCGERFDSGARSRAGGYRRKTLDLAAAGIKAGDLLAGRYEVRNALGGGPLGAVFRVRDREVDVEVALKVIAPHLLQTPDERAEFLRSIKLARRLSHPNLVRVYDAGQIDATPELPARAFFTSQLLEGMTLRRVIQLRRDDEELFSVQEIEPIMAQLAQALEHLSRLGPHGDLKPENVMVMSDMLKVMDFGIAPAIPRAPFLAAQRQRRVDSYVAPEISGGHPFDQASDLYALGVMLGEMLAGVIPSSGSQPPELREQQRSIPTVVEAIYRRVANPDPQVRYATALEFAGEMYNLTQGLPTQSASASASSSASGEASSRPSEPRPNETPWSDQVANAKASEGAKAKARRRPDEAQESRAQPPRRADEDAEDADAEPADKPSDKSSKGRGPNRGSGWPMIIAAAVAGLLAIRSLSPIAAPAKQHGASTRVQRPS